MLDLFKHFTMLTIPAELEWEIVLTDNASTDGTVEWVKELLRINDWNLNTKIVREVKPGLNHAREAGARAAKIEWIIFCDDDNLLDPVYVAQWYKIVQRYTDLGAVGGQGRLDNTDDLPGWVSKYSHSYALGPQAKQSGYLPTGSALYGASLFIRKSPVLKMIDNGYKWVMTDRRGNSLASGGDLEWCFLLQLNGFKLYYEESMIFIHAIKPERFTWSYYLQLKRGIASGVALLEPYRFLLLHGKSTLYFLNYFFVRMLMAQIVFLKHYFNELLSASMRKTDEQQLGLLIVQTKAKSYRSLFFQSFAHFRLLKKYPLANL